MNNDLSAKNQLPEDCPEEGTRRIIDGREAVLGLVAMKEALEDPARLLLAV